MKSLSGCPTARIQPVTPAQVLATVLKSAILQCHVCSKCAYPNHPNESWPAGATTVFAKARDAWKGTLMPVFQPGEKIGAGAQAMIDDGLFKRFPKPDVVLGQHVMVGASGVLNSRTGVVNFRRAIAYKSEWLDEAHGAMPSQHRSRGDGGNRDLA